MKDSSIIYLLLYVNDMLVATMNKTDVARMKEILNAEFDMNDLGAASRILGIEIQRQPFFDSESYIERF